MSVIRLVKKLKNIAEKLWKEVCFKRDGRECQVKKHFPILEINHSEIFQCDHCFSRSNKWLFFEPSNGTVVCSTCNFLKSRQQKSVARAIDTIVKEREGEKKFNEMLSIDMSKKPNVNFSKVWWLEITIEKLKEFL